MSKPIAPHTTVCAIRLPDALLDRAAKRAAELGISKTEVFRHALAVGLADGNCQGRGNEQPAA